MKFKNIPQTDLYPSAICLGTASFGTSIDTSTAFQMLDTFVEYGGNFIDTAHIYGAWVPDGVGLSEKIIGQWVKGRRVEENIVIATKGAHPLLSAMDVPRLSRQDVVADLDESLHYLQTASIDLYWLHRDDPTRPVAEILETLNSQVKQGKIRYFGCSNWRVERIEEAMRYAAEHGLAIVAYTSQAHGYFSKASNNLHLFPIKCVKCIPMERIPGGCAGFREYPRHLRYQETYK